MKASGGRFLTWILIGLSGPVASQALADCYVCLYQDGKQAGFFREYCDRMIPQRQREYSKGGAMSIYMGWTEGQPMPHFAKAVANNLARRCGHLFVIYSGHGPITPAYPEFVRQAQKELQYQKLTVEDSSCLSMFNPQNAQKLLTDPAVLPGNGQQHYFFGNQLVARTDHFLWNSWDTLSYYGIRVEPSGATTHFVYPCNTSNRCGADEEGTVYRCSRDGRWVNLVCTRVTRPFGIVFHEWQDPEQHARAALEEARKHSHLGH